VKLRGLLALALVVLLGVVAAACSSYDSESSDSAGPARLLEPTAYAAILESNARFVVNVHTPDEGQIAGTDVAIPFDELEQRAGELPGERSKLAIYCMSGNMSETAAQTLAAMGYDDVVDLRGGMEAWQASGREIQPSA